MGRWIDFSDIGSMLKRESQKFYYNCHCCSYRSSRWPGRVSSERLLPSAVWNSLFQVEYLALAYSLIDVESLCCYKESKTFSDVNIFTFFLPRGKSEILEQEQVDPFFERVGSPLLSAYFIFFLCPLIGRFQPKAHPLDQEFLWQQFYFLSTDRVPTREP